ncbi:unnamed protein product [Paramecium octaurelia]|uniref:COP9 signalosome complex subunit 3 N-terminal helical repeats domain-containing protein n=1 Tax=Paramecium octaurelia TaxID=43137 RepID=A0A8S1V9A4_PAROT|nr:unnamed protein product [Paramecium octaurelia]
MNFEIDDSDIPNEKQVYIPQHIAKVYQLFHQTARYNEQEMIYLLKFFMEFNIGSIEIMYLNIFRICLTKLTTELMPYNTRVITKMLICLKYPLQAIIFITDLHIAFLQSCIKSYNYKLGYQFIKSKIFLQSTIDKKDNIIIEYFYYAGLIANAMKDYDEALRCYRIAHKFEGSNSFSVEAQKMESLLCFRLGMELKNWSNPASQQLVAKLTSVIENNGDKEIKEKDLDFQDQDVSICLKEQALLAQLYQFLKKEYELHSKVSFDQIIHNFQIQDYETLINLLLQVNNIHNMFTINEEKRYIQFKYNNLTYKEINSKLESKYELLNTLTNKK